MKATPPETVEAIRQSYVPGVHGQKDVARKFGVSTTTVRRILDPAFAERQREVSREAKRKRRGVCEMCGAETRYAGHERAVSRFCIDCGPARGTAAAKARIGQGPVQQHLYRLLATERHFMEIIHELGVSKNHLSSMLHRERTAGRIVRLRRGVYALPEGKK